MTDFMRRLDISVDGEAVQGVSRARLTGRDSIGLRPGSFSQRLWNLGDDG